MRFRPKLIDFKIDPDTNCFILTSHKQPRNIGGGNYAKITRKGKTIAIHRHIWIECFGEIPEGMCVCHKCDNPACINPEHLFLGTHNDNMQDMKNKNRSTYGEKHAMAKLKEIEVKEIRRKRVKYGTKVSELSKEYGISKTQVSRIIRKERWVCV
jgi:hypothetical protein